MTDKTPTVQQILAFEADCPVAGPRRFTAARMRFGVSATRYTQILTTLLEDPTRLTLALALDPITTRLIRERVDRGYAARERLGGRTPR